jgi:hypothetical protein
VPSEALSYINNFLRNHFRRVVITALLWSLCSFWEWQPKLDLNSVVNISVVKS